MSVEIYTKAKAKLEETQTALQSVENNIETVTRKAERKIRQEYDEKMKDLLDEQRKNDRVMEKNAADAWKHIDNEISTARNTCAQIKKVYDEKLKEAQNFLSESTGLNKANEDYDKLKNTKLDIFIKLAKVVYTITYGCGSDFDIRCPGWEKTFQTLHRYKADDIDKKYNPDKYTDDEGIPFTCGVKVYDLATTPLRIVKSFMSNSYILKELSEQLYTEEEN